MRSFFYQKLPIILGLCATLSYLKFEWCTHQKNLQELEFFTRDILITKINDAKDHLKRVPSVLRDEQKRYLKTDLPIEEWIVEYDSLSKIEIKNLDLSSLSTHYQKVQSIELRSKNYLNIITARNKLNFDSNLQNALLYNHPENTIINTQDTFKTSIFLSQNSSHAYNNGVWYINGKRAELQSHDLLFYNETPTKSGKYDLNVALKIENPITKEEQTFSKKFELTVE